MALQNTILNINLDTNRPNTSINTLTEERFLQGNQDKTFVFTFLKNGQQVSILDGVKATVTLVFYKNNSIQSKYVISPTKADGTTNSDYKIQPITANKLTIRLADDVAFYDHAGRTDLIININDGGNFYTYSCSYTLDANEAYNSSGIIDNLPSINSINTKVAAIESDLNTAKQNIASNTSNLNNKANSNLDNVGAFNTAAEGAILYKKDNTLKATTMIVDDANKVISTDYALRTAPNTIMLGDNIEMHENGGFIENHTKSLDKNYLLLDYENNKNTGTSKPIYYQRGALQQKHEVFSVQSTRMNNVTSIVLGNPTENRQVQAIYLQLASSVNNLKIKITINGNDIGYYPSKSAWEGQDVGYNLVSGLQRIELKPFWSSLTSYSITLNLKADTAINLMGDGTHPYYAVDINLITPKNMALEEDISGAALSATDIKNKLETLTDTNRLSANAIKDLDVTLAKKDLSNVLTADFEKKFLTTDAYNRIAQYMNTSHPAVVEQANEIKSSTAVNLSTATGSVIFVDYQFGSNSQVIRQQLPPASQGKYIMFATIYPNPYSNTQIVLSPATGENINDASASYTITRSGFLGIAVPTSGGYIWVQSTNLSGETGNTIVNKLELLKGENRLDASAIKNLSSNITGSIKVAGEQNSPEYTANKLLFPFANSVVNDSGTVTVNTSIVVTDENAEIVPDCSIIEVSTTSLLSATQNTGNSNAAVLDFKGLPVDMGDNTPVTNAKYLSFPQALVSKTGDNKVSINTAPSASVDGTVIVGNAETFEFPSTGGIKAEAVAGTDLVKISSKGIKATSDDILVSDGVKNLDFPVDGLLITEPDLNDTTKLYVNFAGLPVSKTNTSTVRKATKLEFPQANVFGQDGGTVHVGTGHSVSKNDPISGVEEITAACNAWTFTNGLNAEINPNDPNGVIISATDSATGISITNDDTQAANNTLFAYFPQARIIDGSVSDSKVIKTSIPIIQDANSFEDYKKISLSTHDFLVARKQDDNDTLELNFNGISVDSQGNEIPNIKLISLDNEQFEAQGGEVGVADVMLKNPTRSGYLAYINDEMVIPHEFGNRTRVTKIFPNDVLINDSAVVTNAAEKTYTLLAGENGISYNYLISAVINTQLYYDDFNDTFKLYLWDEEGNDYLSDINGNPCIAIKSQQKGTLECTVELTTVVKLATNTKISLRLEDSLSTRLLFIPGILTKISGICIEKLMDDNQLSLARTQFQMDTMRALRVSKHVYGNRFLDAASYLKPGYNLETQNINSDTYALNIDNWLLLCERRSGTVKIENGVMKVLPGADPNYISYGYVIPSETTINLRGTQLEFDIQTEYRHGDMILEAFSWSGQRDDIVPALPQFNSIDENGVYTLKTGWSVINSSTINLPSQDTPTQETKICSCTVPSDCNNIYFVIRSKGIQVSELWVSGAAIGVPGDTPVIKWDINTPLNYNEQHLIHDITTAKFSCNEDSPKDAKMNWADAGVRNQVNIGAKILGNAPIDLVKTPQNNDVDQYYGQTHWRGYLKANFTGSMNVAYSYGVSNWSIADTTDTLTIYMAKGSDIATAVKIPESESTWTITKTGTQSLSPDKSMMAVFKVDNIQPNDVFWMIAEATEGRKFMITDQNEIMITVNALDQYDIDQQFKINDLESQIQELQSILKATADAKTNKAYIELGWDSTNSKPSLEAKQDTTP